MIACKDCRFHDDNWGNNCSHPAVQLPDPVHGSVMEMCTTARSAAGKCGPEAKLFTAKRLRNWLWGCSLSSQERHTP
jgi:hypothetical protein